MKILNLDSLAIADREIVIGGTSYPVPDMSVANFVETSRAAQSMPKDATLADQIESTVDMILRSVPGLPRDQIAGLPMKSLAAITAFIRGDDVPGQTDTSTPAPAAAAPEGEGADASPADGATAEAATAEAGN